MQPNKLAELSGSVRQWARELGFQRIGVSGIDLGAAELRLMDWIAEGFNGGMAYFERHGERRARPAELVPGTVRVISVAMDYLPQTMEQAESVLADTQRGYVSRYALGRDYHKLLRARLQTLCDRIGEAVGPFNYRVFTDSAPVMEVELAARAGLGWRGKHTLLLNREAGSWFFLGEIYTDLALPVSEPVEAHCGTCERCMEVCPTGAIVAPYRLDARKCISYLTIEHAGSIPEDLRPALGNRIYGCDDCQLVCPWNKYARLTAESGFAIRNSLDGTALEALFGWSEAEFLQRLEGSAIRRIGHERWLRNIAVALGNAAGTPAVIAALRSRADHASALVREHVAWALARHGVAA